MLNKAQLERIFVASIMLAFVSLVIATVGIKSQLFQNFQFFFLFLASIFALIIGFQAKTIKFISNRLQKQITGWLISAVFSSFVWSFAQ